MRSFDSTVIARADLKGSIWRIDSALAGGFMFGVLPARARNAAGATFS